jgi:SpoVK/Ycf46/Vps4 family AAA+-type ATPase
MGQVYYYMGFLSSTEVIECSASDLIGQYVGQTGPKTKKVFERALGRVLFIDEAYRLGEGHFAKEAIDELVDILTQERFMSKVVVILAGYDQEMNQLMAVNTGLSSRFSEEIVFSNMTSPHCVELLNRELKKKSIQLDGLGDPSSLIYVEMKGMIERLSSLPSWGNARDIKTLSKKMVNHVFTTATETSDSPLKLDREDAMTCINTMLMDRIERCANVPTRAISKLPQQMLSADPPLPPAPPIHNTHITTSPPALAVKKATATTQLSDGRDLGVTDEIWNQLQADIQAAEAASKASEDAIQLAEKTLQEATIREEAQRKLAKKLAQTRAKDAAAQDELKRQQEQARIKEYEAMVERERVAAMLEEKRKEEARQRRQEAKAQAALRQMGVCVAGFRWIKQPSGYRCAGGSHFVDNAALGI